MGLHGQAFLDAVPLPMRNGVEAAGNYDERLNIASMRAGAGMNRFNFANYVRQFNPGYDTYSAAARGQARKEFLAGGQSSPAGQITYLRTARATQATRVMRWRT